MRPQALDLFCGAGGASLGLLNAGFGVTAAVDHAENPLKTHKHNLAGETIQHDLTKTNPSILPTTDVAYIHGSPPCKGFSHANEDRDRNDPRNSLVFSYIDWVADLQPAVATMENVAGMLTITDGFMPRVRAAFRDAGYRVKHRVLNAADYGVPQTRERVYTIAIRDGVSVSGGWFPTPTHAESRTQTLSGTRLSEWRTVADAFAGIDESCPNMRATNHSQQLVDRFRRLAWGEGSEATAKQQQVRLHPERPAPTVTGNPTDFVHPHEPRVLTVREMAALQSFPEWFEFLGVWKNGGSSRGSVVSRVEQAGNAVPPRLQEAVARRVMQMFR